MVLLWLGLDMQETNLTGELNFSMNFMAWLPHHDPTLACSFWESGMKKGVGWKRKRPFAEIDELRRMRNIRKWLRMRWGMEI
jgi:hypothetical protein